MGEADEIQFEARGYDPLAGDAPRREVLVLLAAAENGEDVRGRAEGVIARHGLTAFGRMLVVPRQNYGHQAYLAVLIALGAAAQRTTVAGLDRAAASLEDAIAGLRWTQQWNTLDLNARLAYTRSIELMAADLHRAAAEGVGAEDTGERSTPNPVETIRSDLATGVSHILALAGEVPFPIAECDRIARRLFTEHRMAMVSGLVVAMELIPDDWQQRDAAIQAWRSVLRAALPEASSAELRHIRELNGDVDFRVAERFDGILASDADHQRWFWTLESGDAIRFLLQWHGQVSVEAFQERVATNLKPIDIGPLGGWTIFGLAL